MYASLTVGYSPCLRSCVVDRSVYINMTIWVKAVKDSQLSWEELGQFKKKTPHRDLNPRPSGLQHSGLTTTLPRTAYYFPGVKRQRRESNHSHLSNVEVKKSEALPPRPLSLHGTVLNELNTRTRLHSL
jgi:hypothetical protein